MSSAHSKQSQVYRSQLLDCFSAFYEGFDARNYTRAAVKPAWMSKQAVLIQQLVIVKNVRDVSVTDVRLSVTLSLSFVHALKQITLWESERQSETMH